ncbi:tyrosine--tRNA ligase, partial [Salmonella enterica subsp. enterica serovar Enteritidis]
IALYVGFDPTGDSLHAGHLVPMIMLRRFQEAGHKPLALAGGATGFIGDPRDVGERSMLSQDEIDNNLEAIKKQLRQFVDFDSDNPAIMVNNADWTMNM